MLHGEPEYRRRRRQEAAENQHNAEREWDEASKKRNAIEIVSALKTITEKLERAENEKAPKNKNESRRHRWEIAGLWVAAAVGVAAIWFGNQDATEQRTVMERQAKIMIDDQRPWLGMGFVGYPPDGPFQLQFINGGKSPALDVAISAKIVVDVTGVQPQLPNARCTPECRVDGIELLPNIPFQFVLLREQTGINPAVFADKAAWIIGRADYKDARGTPHKTGICLYHRPDRHDLISCPIPNSNYAD